MSNPDLCETFVKRVKSNPALTEKLRSVKLRYTVIQKAFQAKASEMKTMIKFLDEIMKNDHKASNNITILR